MDHRMRDLEDVARLVRAQADMMSMLAIVARLELPDWFLGAGFVRNAVWDALHGRVPDVGTLRDIDLVYFDPVHCTAERDLTVERQLCELVPSVPWDVKNQARMHARNGDTPYRDCADAIAQWPETATAIGGRLVHGALAICAPHGVGDLLAMVVRPTPRFREKPEALRARMQQKQRAWATRWPKLTFVE